MAYQKVASCMLHIRMQARSMANSMIIAMYVDILYTTSWFYPHWSAVVQSDQHLYLHLFEYSQATNWYGCRYQGSAQEFLMHVDIP